MYHQNNNKKKMSFSVIKKYIIIAIFNFIIIQPMTYVSSISNNNELQMNEFIKIVTTKDTNDGLHPERNNNDDNTLFNDIVSNNNNNDDDVDDEIITTYALHKEAHKQFKKISTHNIEIHNSKNKNKAPNTGCSICMYIAKSISPYLHSIENTWKEWETISERRRYIATIIQRQACYPIQTKKIARIMYKLKKNQFSNKYVHFDDLMNLKLNGNEQIETGIQADEISQLMIGCNFVKDHLIHIVTDIFLSKHQHSFEEILCDEVIKICSDDVAEAGESKRRRALKNKLNEEANKRLKQTGNARAPGTQAG